MDRPITYGDLYAFLLFLVVVVLFSGIFLLDHYSIAQSIVAYLDKTAMQYMHMRGETFKHAEHRERKE
jgi:hypothetical protein